MQDEGRNKETVSAQLSQPSELMKNEIKNYISRYLEILSEMCK
jgi:ribosomal protein S17E